MFQKLKNRIQHCLGLPALAARVEKLSIEARIAAGFSRGAAGIGSRGINPCAPGTWEFGAFSQHGEDGILEYLVRNLKSSDKYFLEIAAGDGLENCTAYLALGGKWSGVLVEGDHALADHCRMVYQNRIWNVMVQECYVNLENIDKILSKLPAKNFDLFSLDIDSIDFHLLKATLASGYLPKILVVEYNSAFGPTQSVTVPYKPVFNRWDEHPAGIYYGASVMAWRNLLEPMGYKFVSVDSSGTNAFFAHRSHFHDAFLESLLPINFLNNTTDINPVTLFSRTDNELGNAFAVPDWEKQYPLISHLPLETVNKLITLCLTSSEVPPKME